MAIIYIGFLDPSLDEGIFIIKTKELLVEDEKEEGILTLYYEEHGDKNAPLIVFLHGEVSVAGCGKNK